MNANLGQSTYAGKSGYNTRYVKNNYTGAKIAMFLVFITGCCSAAVIFVPSVRITLTSLLGG